MRVLTAQLKPEFDIEINKKRLLKILNENADFYIFPELYLTGYLLRDEILRVAIRKEDKILKEIAKASKDKVVIFGFPEKEREIYNSAAVIVDGEVHVARKLYLPNFGPFEEKLYFKEGEKPFLIETQFGKIGVQICYDAFFPEVAKMQAMQGANFIANISASPITSRAMFEKLIPARAIENTVFFAYVNWAGLQRTMEFWGGSMLYSPRGSLIYKAPYFEEDIHISNVDLDELDVARRVRPTLRDTRMELMNILSYPLSCNNPQGRER